MDSGSENQRCAGAPVLLAKAFHAFVPVAKATGEEQDGRRIVNGVPGLIEKPDYDDDILGLDAVEKAISEYPERFGGHVDWDHMYDRTRNAKWIIGKALQTARVDGLPNLATLLFDGNEHADTCWDLLQRDASLGYSLKGILKARDRRGDPRRVTGLEIHMMTIAPTPKGFDGVRIRPGLPPDAQPLGTVLKAHAWELAHGTLQGWQPVEEPEYLHRAGAMDKALTTGDGAVEAGDTGARAVRRESIQGAGEQVRCPDCRCRNHRRRCRCRRCGCALAPEQRVIRAKKAIAAPSELEKALAAAGVTNSAAVAAIIAAP